MTVTPFTFTKATKTKRKARIALVGYEGAGKTYTALIIGSALAAHDAKRLALADSEGDSALIYGDRFDFDHVRLTDHSPATYAGVLRAAIAAGYGALIYDSMSHEWIGAGGALEMKDRLSADKGDAGGFTAWAKVTPEHNKVFAGVVNASIHIVATMRQKKAYVVEQNDKGKNAPRLIGTEAVQREGAEYEFDLILNLDRDGIVATVAKSRYIGIEQGRTFPKPSTDLAALIIAALDEGTEPAATAALPISSDELTTIVRLGTNATEAVKTAFYDTWLPEHGFSEPDRALRWKRFVKEGGVLGVVAIEWWRESIAPAPVTKQAEPTEALEHRDLALADDLTHIKRLSGATGANTTGGEIAETPRETVPPLAIGQWLGTANTIMKLEHFSYGWRITDASGATLKQPDSPDGIWTAIEKPRDASDGRVRPWPVFVDEPVEAQR